MVDEVLGETRVLVQVDEERKVRVEAHGDSLHLQLGGALGLHSARLRESLGPRLVDVGDDLLRLRKLFAQLCELFLRLRRADRAGTTTSAAQQLLSQRINLSAQRADDLGVRVLVHDGGVDNLLRARRVAERGHGLLVVYIGRRDGGDHDRLAVAAQ